MKTISEDGERWHEIDDELFEKMLADPDVDCWVDMSGPRDVCHVALSMLRSLRNALPVTVDWDGKPKRLYGIPVTFTEES